MIILGADHAGFALKEDIKKEFKEKNIKYLDISEKYIDGDDYTDVVIELCSHITSKDKGIMVCGTGIGSSIIANKIKGIRAAICYDEYTAKMTRYHNDANLLCLGGRTTIAGNKEVWWEIIETFINTQFSNESRHIRRLERISKLENGGK